MIGAGQLRERVRFERQASIDDGYGNTRGAWEPVCTVWARVVPKPARDEVVQAGRLQGAALYTIAIRSSLAARDIREGDRAVVVTEGGPVPAGTAFNIRFIGDLDGRRDVVTMDAERGVAT